jgi:hypothetical protein
VLVPWGARPGVPVAGGGELVGGDAGDDRLTVLGDVVETEAVGQRHVAFQHALVDLDGDLGAAAPGAEPDHAAALDADPEGVGGVDP